MAIVKKSCYAGVIGAKPVGDKFVDRIAKFIYNSFSYSKASSASRQKLVCEVEFCVIKDGKGFVNLAEKTFDNSSIV